MRKLFMISFEGMNYDFIMNLIEKSYLKNFQRILQEGFIRKIDCSRIPYEASGLMTVFSGMKDAEHGIGSYWKARNKNYIPEIWNSDDIKDFMFWNQKKYKDKRFNIINIFGTHPTYQINGNMISYCMERSLKYTFPNELKSELLKSGFAYFQDTGVFFKAQGKEKYLDKILKIEKMRHNICKELLKKDADIIIANYTCIDRVCHFYMNELRERYISLEETAVFQAYMQCDEILGDIIDYVEKNYADLLLFSSVGFGHLKKFVEINPYLEEKGFLKWNSNRIPDWKHTIAFEAPQGCHGININRKSFYSQGIISDSDYSEVIAEVINQLKKMNNPYNDNPMFFDVFEGKNYFKKNENVPDIIVEPYDWEYLPYGDNYWADKVFRHFQTGWHRSSTVCGGLGKCMCSDIRDRLYNLSDILSVVEDIIDKPGY